MGENLDQIDGKSGHFAKNKRPVNWSDMQTMNNHSKVISQNFG